MKVSRILGLSVTLAVCAAGGWLGCSDDEVVNNPNGLDAGKPDTGTKPADTGTGEETSTTDAGSDTSTPTDAASAVTVSATLSQAQELPVPTAETGSGTGTVVVSADRKEITATLNVTGLTNIAAAHIHLGKVGATGGVAFALATASFTSPLTKTFKASDFPDGGAAGAATFADAVAAILGGGAYFNVHTTVNTAGSIRGQIGAVPLKATLDKTSEVPPTTTAATGTATVTLNDAQDAVTVALTVTGLEADAGITQGHIHIGAVGANGPVSIPLFTGALPSPFSKTFTAADLKLPDAGGAVATFPEVVNALLSNNAYVNIHTTTNQGGAIRGQIVAQ